MLRNDKENKRTRGPLSVSTSPTGWPEFPTSTVPEFAALVSREDNAESGFLTNRCNGSPA